MTFMATRNFESGSSGVLWGFLILSAINIASDRLWPESIAATMAGYACLTYVAIWFSLRIRTGYRRRRPYWTRESWQRYLRLAAMPVAALIVLFALLYLFDSSASLFGSPRSAARGVWILVLLALMIFGAVGGVTAVEWMARGEQSQQFTRTRWFRRRGASAIAD